MKLIILRGLPGSGKSTYIDAHLPTFEVCSADHYFIVNGDYQYNPAKLGEAHGVCFKKAVAAITSGKDVVIDNTSITAIEIAPYMALGNAYGYDCEIIMLNCSIEQSFARNTHGVPMDGIRRMSASMRLQQFPYYWKQRTV